MSFFRTKKFYTLLIIIIILGVIYFIPAILSKTVAKKMLVHAVEKKMQGSFSLETVQLSWFGPQQAQNAHFSNSDYSLSVTEASIDIPLWSLYKLKDAAFDSIFKLRTNSSLQNLSIEIKKDHLKIYDINLTAYAGKTMQYQLSGYVQQNSLIGQFSCLLDQIEDKYHFDITTDHVPSAVLQFIPHIDPSWDYVAILGNTFSTHIDGNFDSSYQGPFSLRLSSDNTFVIAAFEIKKNTVFLTQPLDGKFFISKELSQKLLDPQFILSFHLQNPLHLRIEPEGFSMPVGKNALQNVIIKKGVLEVGKVHMQNGPITSMVMGVLSKNFLTGIKEMEVWFAPQSFQMKEGILYLDRMDCLVDMRLQLCSWGQIDWTKKNVDMKLGITAAALKEAFNIQGLPDNYVLTMRMKGPFNKIKVNTKKATEKIAAMIAAQQAKNQIHPLFGSFLDILQKEQKQENIPKPNRPFPWE